MLVDFKNMVAGAGLTQITAIFEKIINFLETIVSRK
jgi:hypothetical protein